MDRINVELGATMAYAFLAADFCTQPETFPVFLAWVQSRGMPVDWTPEKMRILVGNLRELMQMAGDLSDV